jgi:hypothetical protein
MRWLGSDPVRCHVATRPDSGAARHQVDDL